MERAVLSGRGGVIGSNREGKARTMGGHERGRIWPVAMLITVALTLMVALLVSSPVWAGEDIDGYVHAAGVHIGFSTDTKTTWVDRTFTLNIRVRTYGQPVDSAQAYIDFDPSLLEVVDADPGTAGDQIQRGTALPDELQNSVDNALGRIDFAAGIFGGQPLTGTFTLATVEFKAKAATGGTPLSFVFVAPRETKVSMEGLNQLSTYSDGTVIIGGDPFTVTATADPSVLPVGGSISTISAHVVDQYGTDVVNGTVVTFTTSGGDFGGSATTTETTHDGIATANLSSGTLVETITVTATADSKFDTTTVSFEPGPPAFVTVVAIPPSLRIGWYGQWTAAISATVRDQYLNLVEDGTAVEFIVVQTDRADVLPRWCDTVGGVATSTLYSKQTIGVATVYATSGLVSGFFDVMLTPGLPYSLTVSSNPPTIPVGGENTVVTADVRDIGGYHVEDGTLVTFGTDKGDFAGLTISSSTTLNGLASVVLSSPNLIGTATITATSDSVVGYGSVVFLPGPPRSVAISADDTTLQLGEYGQFTTAVRVEVQDTYGNWVSDGTEVEFYTTRGDVNPGTVLTHDGFAVSTLYSPSIGPPGWAQVWAHSGSAPPDWVDVYYDIGPPYQISVAADPDAIDLVGRTSAITATIKDIAGNLVADGTVVSFMTDLGLVSPVTTTTNLGLVTTTLTSETTSGWAKVIAQSDSKSGSVDVLFRSDPPWRVLVTANPAEIPANGVSVSYINAYITDGYDNPVTDGTVVIFATDRGQVNGGGVYTATTTGGICLAVLTSSPTPGLATVNVSTLNGRSGRDYVNFVEVRNYPVYMPVVMKKF